MLVLEKDGFYFKVESEDDKREFYHVIGLSITMGTDGTIYYPRETNKDVITFEEAKDYNHINEDDSRFRKSIN